MDGIQTFVSTIKSVPKILLLCIKLQYFIIRLFASSSRVRYYSSETVPSFL